MANWEKHEKHFEKMENIALSDKSMVFGSNKKYFELELSQHTKDFRALIYGKGNMLTQAIGNVFDFSKLKSKGIYIGEYKNNKLASALRFSDDSCLTPVDPNCGTLCTLVGNEKDSAYNIQKELLKSKGNLTTPAEKLDFIEIKDLKPIIKKQDITIKKENYERFKIVELVTSEIDIPYFFMYRGEKSHIKSAFEVPLSVSVINKIYKKFNRPRAQTLGEKIIRKNNLHNEIDIMFRALEKSQTKIEGHLSSVKSIKNDPDPIKEVDMSDIIISLQHNDDGRIFRCPSSQGLGLSFLSSDYLLLKESMEVKDRLGYIA